MSFSRHRESIVVGYTLPNDSIVFYAGIDNPQSFYSYEDAADFAAKANKDRNSRVPDATSEWQVYRMRFDLIDPAKETKKQ